MTRRQIEDEIERLIALLDQMDGNPDAEIETDHDLNPISLDFDRRPEWRVRRAA
ncbi:hypothetical protein [Pelagibacterium lacus]|uniref:hypothetical protein n=1 Tax=Pelagibacterium lacus TaxID=2282655 RepID=UPI001314E233|nr:hypothetical protein [Pelagibacterium lacus]